MSPGSVTPSPTPNEPSRGHQAAQGSCVEVSLAPLSGGADIDPILSSFPKDKNFRVIVDTFGREALQIASRYQIFQLPLVEPYLPASPNGDRTFLDVCRESVAARSKTQGPFLLKEECADLRTELEACRLVSIGCSRLGRWDAVERASFHMLHLIDFVCAHCPDDTTTTQSLGAHRRDAFMMNVFARVHQVELGDPHMAISLINRLLPQLRDLFFDDANSRAQENLTALEKHREWLRTKEPTPHPPPSPDSTNQKDEEPVPSEFDISPILRHWDHETMRKIRNADGETLIQRRFNFGIAQYNVHEHPLGSVFGGHHSMVRHLEAAAVNFQREHGIAFKLDDPVFVALRQDCAVFFERAECREAFGEWHAALEDLTVCIRSVRFISKHASQEGMHATARVEMPSLLAHKVRALSEIDLLHKQYERAIQRIDSFMRRLPLMLPEASDAGRLEKILESLSDHRQDCIVRMPKSCSARLHCELASELTEALQSEDYHLAARIQDQLRQLTERQAA